MSITIRRRSESLVQIVAFGTGIMVLLLLGIVRDDLNSDWRRTLPADIPNYFFVNIPPPDREAFVQFLKDLGAKTARVLPMIEEVERSGDARTVVKGILDRHDKLMGFGHRVYRTEDPRARVLPMIWPSK